MAAPDGWPLGTSSVNLLTIPVCSFLGDCPHELIQFHVVDYLELLLVIGHPWLMKHNPYIDWAVLLRGGNCGLLTLSSMQVCDSSVIMSSSDPATQRLSLCHWFVAWYIPALGSYLLFVPS